MTDDERKRLEGLRADYGRSGYIGLYGPVHEDLCWLIALALSEARRADEAVKELYSSRPSSYDVVVEERDAALRRADRAEQRAHDVGQMADQHVEQRDAAIRERDEFRKALVALEEFNEKAPYAWKLEAQDLRTALDRLLADHRMTTHAGNRRAECDLCALEKTA